MRPFQHFLIALIPVVICTLVWKRRLPSGYAVLIVLFATQLPDLIDKPLAWTFGILPSGRAGAHSIVLSGPLLVVGYVFASRRDSEFYAGLFVIAYLSHLAGDFYPVLWLGSEYHFFPNLFWPLLSANPDGEMSFLAHTPSSPGTIITSVLVFVVTAGYIVMDITRHHQ